MQLNSSDDVRPWYKHIYLSPHFDDAVYSCGGTLGWQGYKGERTLVVTIFAGIPTPTHKLSPLAQRTQQLMEFNGDIASLIADRRAEDIHATAHVQADCLWLDYLDAIYRGSPPYYKHRRAIFAQGQPICGQVHPGDKDTIESLCRDLLALHEQVPDAIWYAPLAVGKHVDHQIVFSAADHLLQSGANVRFYEDFPYVLGPRTLHQLRPRALPHRLKELGNTLQPLLVDVIETVHLRQEASEMYGSQVRLNFGDRQNMLNSIYNYAASIQPTKSACAERFWCQCN